MFGKKEKIVTQIDSPSESEISATKKSVAAKKKKKGPNVFQRIGKWFRELKSELKKVVWPTWRQVFNNTWVVILCIIVVAVVLWVFDYVSSQGVSALIYAFNK